MTDDDISKRYPIIAGFLVGLVFIMFGFVFVFIQSPAKDIMIGTGSSIIASLVVYIIFFTKDELSHRTAKYGVRELFHNRHKHLSDVFWTDFLSSAKTQVIILGVANHGYVNKSDGALRDKESSTFSDLITRRKVKVTILWLHPARKIAEIRDDEENRSTRGDIIRSILAFYNFRQSLPKTCRPLLTLKVYDATPTCGATIVDDSMVVAHYLAERPNLAAPGFILTKNVIDRILRKIHKDHEHGALYDVYLDNARHIERIALDVNETLIIEFRRLLNGLKPGSSESDMR